MKSDLVYNNYLKPTAYGMFFFLKIWMKMCKVALDFIIFVIFRLHNISPNYLVLFEFSTFHSITVHLKFDLHLFLSLEKARDKTTGKRDVSLDMEIEKKCESKSL